MPQIVTAIDIAAPRARVWEVLTDTHSYREWNPLMRSFDGTLRVGEKIRAKVEAEGYTLPIDAEISRVAPGEALSWVGPFLKPARFFGSGEHFFELKDLGDGKTRLLHGEKFRGIVFDMETVWAKVSPRMEPLYESFNRAIKARCEATK